MPGAGGIMPTQPGEQTYLDLLKMQMEAGANTRGMTQMGPGGTPLAPIQHPITPVSEPRVSSFGVGERGAHQRESMQNLVKAGQSFANTITQMADQKKQREFQVVLGEWQEAN